MTKERLVRVRDALMAEQLRRRRAAELRRLLDEIDAAATEFGPDIYADVLVAMNTRSQ